MGHEINGGDDDGNSTQVDASWGPQVSRWSVSELDEEMVSAAASDTDVGNCRVGRECRYRYIDMVGRLGVGMATVAEKRSI